MKNLTLSVRVTAGVAIISAIALSSVCAQEPSESGTRCSGSVSKMLLARFDANKDEAMTENEVPARMWKHLSKADTDKDGSVTGEELDGAMKNIASRGGEMVEKTLFKMFDANKDGALSEDEVPDRMWQRLSMMDTDKDGSVTKEELENKIRNIIHNGPAAIEKMLFDKFDADKDGALTENEVPAMMWKRLSRADANKDGSVTREEMRAAIPGKKIED